MKNIYSLLFVFAVGISFANVSCTSKETRNVAEKKAPISAVNYVSNITIDSASIVAFFSNYPELKHYRKEVFALYKKHHYNQIWFDEKGIVEFANTLYARTNDLDKEGVMVSFPYQGKLEGIFNADTENTLSNSDTELMITNLYLFYADKVYKGLDDKTTKEIGWLLPRKQISYAHLLDSIIERPEKLEKDDKVLFRQYYKLRDVLQRYRDIEKKGGWAIIAVDPAVKAYKLADSAKAIQQLRERLFITRDIQQNSKSAIFDAELLAAVKKYQSRNGLIPDGVVGPRMLREMNVPVGERIKKILVNMERCRWISPEITNAKAYVVVNIPSYRLKFIKEGKSELESAVVVGKTMNKTVIFSGNMSHIVFSPYWNVPQSIINKEIKPAMARNKNYLAQQNMEWNNGRIRQKPGKNNSLGLVKFIFPNSNNIYLHDTPSKWAFEKESRAFSHGCIRVAKPKELAIAILEDDKKWTPARIDAAMHAGKESTYILKEKIPVYIGYFTAWVDDDGEVRFYEDVYERDDRLAKLLYTEK